MLKKENKIFVISGPSGIGKSTIVAELLKVFPDAGKILNSTSRRPRKGEVELKDFRFLSTEEFVSKFERDEFLEAGQYVGECYGTSVSDFDEACLKHDVLFWILDVKGVKNIKEKGLKNVSSIFVKPCQQKHVKERLNNRGFSEKEMQDRIEQAEWEISQTSVYDYEIENEHGQMQKTVDEIAGIVKKELL